MKTKVIIFMLLWIVGTCCQPLCAGKWRVSNVTGIVANYTSLQVVNDSPVVVAGDTVYLEGSTINYGDITLNKKLIIVGPGYFLGENDSTQANKVPACVNYLTVNPGSEGSLLTGISITATMTLNAGSIVVQRCHGTFSTLVYSSNNIIIQGFFSKFYIYAYSQNNLIRNNFFYAPVNSNEYALHMDYNTNAVVYNNIISGHHRICNAEFRNNIATGTEWYNNLFYNGGGCTISNNICASDQYSLYSSNLSFQDMNTVFVCWNSCTGFSSDERYKLLQPSSPAIGYGYNGADGGIYGGAQPYVLSGIPCFPAVWELVVDGIDVTVKAKSH